MYKYNGVLSGGCSRVLAGAGFGIPALWPCSVPVFSKPLLPWRWA
jgi:hypothetical protein